MNITRRIAMFAVAGTIALEGAAAAEGDSLQDDTTEYAPFFPLYSCSTSQQEVLAPMMRAFSAAFFGKSISALEQNPRCCVWFEIVCAANPGSDGWFVWHEAGGTIITATEVSQMEKAVDVLNRLAITENGQRMLRTGITTSLPVHSVPATMNPQPT